MAASELEYKFFESSMEILAYYHVYFFNCFAISIYSLHVYAESSLRQSRFKTKLIYFIPSLPKNNSFTRL